MKKLLRVLIGFLPILLLAACGGGGSKTVDPATNAVAGAPTVLTVTPADGETGVRATAPITVVFSKAMNVGTFRAATPTTAGTFTLSYVDTQTSVNGFGNYTTVFKKFVVPGTLTADATGKSFTFTPAATLAAIDPITQKQLHVTRSYTLTITGGSNGVTDAGGTPMNFNFISSFNIWAGTQQNGSLEDDVMNGVAADASGNAYLGGYTYGSLGTTPSSSQNIDPSGQSLQALVTMYDPNGTQQWTSQLGATPQIVSGATLYYDSSFLGVAFDGVTGTLVAAGYTNGTVNQTGQLNPTQANPDPTGGTDNYVLAKYDGSGNLLWTVQSGPGGGGAAISSIARAVTTDVNGNVYVAGETHGNLRNGASSFTATYAGGADVFVAKYNPNGNLVWCTVFGTAGDDIANGVGVDPAGNVYVGGQTTGALAAAANAGGNDAFLVKLSANGGIIWGKQWGTAGDDEVNAVSVTSSGSAVYLAGGTAGSLFGGNAGGFDGFVVKVDAGGGVAWSSQFGGAGNDDALGITLDALGNVFVTGYSYGGMFGAATTGGSDVFLIKYSPLGAYAWSQQYGSDQTDVGTGVAIYTGAHGTLLNPEEFVYLAGYTYGNLDTNFNMDLSFNSADYFLSRFDAIGGTKF